MEFVGRERELEGLRRQYESAAGAFVPIYGRRRLGKSELITRFMRDRPGLYYVGKEAPAQLQLRGFMQAAAHAVGDSLLGHVRPAGWREALQLVVERYTGSEKLIIALDEFQWTVAASPELPSTLQELWDREWQESGRVMLILCGSQVGFMEREVLGSRSPLFGRRTAQIRLRPFDLREARRFHPEWSLTDVARARFLCGGIPLYLRALRRDRSIPANIQANFLDELAPLRHEADFLLREELREIPVYHAVLTALATGSAPLRELATATGQPKQNLSYHLDRLVDLGYVRRRYPLSGARPAARHVRFTLRDPLLRFWFRFVFPNIDFLATMGPARTFETRIAPHLPAWFGSCFEELAREALPYFYAADDLTAAFEIGEYWDKTLQIDLVSLRDDGWTDIGECKWGRIRSPKQVAEELARKVTAWPNKRGDTIGRWVFAREPLADDRAKALGVRWVGLEQIYG